MVVSFVKNWFKSWVFWAWVLFIGLLASDADSLPKLQSAEEKEVVKKKKKIIRRKKVVKAKEVIEDENDVNETETKIDEENDQIIYVSPEIILKDENESITAVEIDNEITNEEDIFESKIEFDDKMVSDVKENEDSESNLKVEETIADESGEVSDNRDDNDDEEDDVQWIDVGRGTGLARYSGFQNLLDTEESNDKPLIVERRTPITASRREGAPLTFPRGMLIKSLSQEKDRLEEIPEEDRQPSPRPGEHPSDNSDKIWAQLVARYAEEAEKIQKIENRLVLTDPSGKLNKQRIKDFSDENMTSKEFSEEVGKRLQLYLECVEENSEIDINVDDDDGTREIEDDEEVDNIDPVEDGKHKIFIMIEDEDSNGERDEGARTDEFNASNSDFEIEHFNENIITNNEEIKDNYQMKDNVITNEMKDNIVIIVTDFTAEENLTNEEFPAEENKCHDQVDVGTTELITNTSETGKEAEDVVIFNSKSVYLEQIDSTDVSADQNHEYNLTEINKDDLNVLDNNLNLKQDQPYVIDYNSYSIVNESELKSDDKPVIEIKVLESKQELMLKDMSEVSVKDPNAEVKEAEPKEPLVEVKESESKDAPVFTVTLKRKTKPSIDAEIKTEDNSAITEPASKSVVEETYPLPVTVSESIPVHKERESEDVPAITFVLPKKRKIIAKADDEEFVKPSSSDAPLIDDDLIKNMPQIKDAEIDKKNYRKSLPSVFEDTLRKSEENLIKQKLGDERRSSRDLWKMECDKLLEEPNLVDMESLEGEKGEDIFITRYEEFPEDYVADNDDVAEGEMSVNENNKEGIADIPDEAENVCEKENIISIMESDFEIVLPSSNKQENVDSSVLNKNDTETDTFETVSLSKRKFDQNLEEEDENNKSKDKLGFDNFVEKSEKKIKEETEEKVQVLEDNNEDLEHQDGSSPKPSQLLNVCDILTHSEQNLVARILAQKKDDYDETEDDVNDIFETEAEGTNFYLTDSLQDLTSKDGVLDEEIEDDITITKRDIVEDNFLDEDKLEDVKEIIEPTKTDDKLLSTDFVHDVDIDSKSTDIDESKSAKDSLTEKEIILELIRKERDPNKELIDDSEVPEYLDDVRDLLVPRARRKKVRRRYDALSEIMKVNEHEPSKSALEQNLLVEEGQASRLLRELTPENKATGASQADEFLLTEEEQQELEEIKKEQEAYRAAQRKELEKFLTMPAALTEQEQRELEEFLAEEETDKVAIAGSEARLEALLADVRRRLLESGMDLGDENLDRYMSLPVDLTEEEERMLSNEEEEKGRNDFESDEDYRDYIKQRYLDELEEDRIRVEEEELEFGEYYDDEYDYEDDEYGGEYTENDFVVMRDLEEDAKTTLKDEAVGPDEPLEFESTKEKKGKKFFSIPGLRSRGSSKGSSRGSKASLDKQGSKDSSREGSVSGDAKDASKQTKKFFRFGSLSIKRKKKTNEYPQCDPSVEVKNELEGESNAVRDICKEEIDPKKDLEPKKSSTIVSALLLKKEFDDDNELSEIIRKKKMLLLLKSMQKRNKNGDANLKSMECEKKEYNDEISDFYNNNKRNNNINMVRNYFTNVFNEDCATTKTKTFTETSQDKQIYSQNDENNGINDWVILDPDDSKRHSLTSVEDSFILVNKEQPNASLIPNISNVKSISPKSESPDRLSKNKNVKAEGLTSDCQVLSEVSNRNDTAMSGEGGGLATSSANGGVSDEELWPEESNNGEDGDEFARMEKEVILEMEKEKDKKKRDGDKKGKKKRKKKGDSEKENKKSVYQNKDELYEKHVGPRIRSFDAAKMKSKFNKPKEPTQVSSDCRICGKQVFQMEKIVAEKASWHKNCFRCKECNKNLTLETYQSHEGALYCKPHFKELFRPKAVIQDEAEERKDRLMRRPRMIVLESNPEILPDDVVRATSKPDYGLEELQQTLNVKERFAVFENLSKEEEKPRTEPVSVRRSQSLMSKAARFLEGQEDGEFCDEEDDEEEEDEEEEEEEDGEDENEKGEDAPDGENEDAPVVKSRNKKKKERPMSFSGMGDLKSAWEQKQRREEMKESRKEEITRFRQMLCAGKNLSLKEKFESGNFDDNEDGDANPAKEEIKIEGKRAASNLKKRFEQGEPFILEDDDEEGEDDEGRSKKIERVHSERHEVEEIFKEAETAKKARNVFKQIDSKVAQEGTAILRSHSFASSNRDNRHSMDASVLMRPSAPTCEVVKSTAKGEDYTVDTTDLATRFKFFKNYEQDKEVEREKSRKVFRITPPREGIDQVEDTDFSKAIMPKPCMAVNCAVCKLRRDHGSELDMLGRDPNLIRYTDNYQDDVDCRNTRNILEMFKKMEQGDEEEEEEDGPKPLKRFTPPPGAENGEEESDEEYTDEEYSDEEEEEEAEGDNAAKVRDELLQMSARKAASLRAKFERWESEVDRQNDINKDKEEPEEGMPSLDTAKNLKAMFEHKAIEVAKPVASKPITQKVNRFVGGGGEKCVSCDKTVYVMEKLDIHGKVLHKHCFKCFKCNTQLSVGSFSFGGGNNMFCSTHYKQLFTEKGGSYDAFTQEKGKWTKKIEEMNGELKSHD